MLRHAAAITLTAALIALLYGKVSSAYFCGYDDFADIHRAVFEDTRNPERIFSTTNFGTPKYRPLQRGLTYVTWYADHGAAGFRLRNLAFHMLGAALIYGISWLLFHSRAAAFGAGILFGIHPLANQSVVAAIWTNTTAYAAVLLAFFLFLSSLQAQRRWRAPLAGALVATLISLFLYESTIVVYGFFFGYLFVSRVVRGKPLPPGFAAVLAGGSAVTLGLFFGARRMFVSQALELTPVPAVFHNLAMYIGALLVPVDWVWLNSLFGTPLPSDLTLSTGLLILTLGIAVAVAAAVLVVARRRPISNRFIAIEWPEVGFLAAAIPFSLAPFLAFTAHASETYLYLAVGLYAVILSLVVTRVSGSPRTYSAILSLLVILFAAGVWERNQRVAACGATAQAIVEHLPTENWRSGPRHIQLATPADDPPFRMYGIYAYHGLSTIEPPGLWIPTTQMWLQVVTGNEDLTVEVIPASRMAECTQAGACFWVSDRGEVKDATLPSPAAQIQPLAQ